MFEQQVRAEFDRVRHKAVLRDVVAVLSGRSNDLVPYHELRRRVSPERESYRGVRSVPIERIVGSMDRPRDFDRGFRPRQRHTAGRWQSVDRAHLEGKFLPPIELYQLGDVYFVKDGNHRVSVAREKGQQFIDAEVVEGHVRAPLRPEMTTDELLAQAEYAEFLRRTDLDRLRPDHALRPTALGRYEELWSRIQEHGERLAAARGRLVSAEETVTDWYDGAYRPVVDAVRAREGGRSPSRSDADVYLAVARHRDDLARRQGLHVDPVAAAVDHAAGRSALRRLPARVARLATDGLRFTRSRRAATPAASHPLAMA